jgi:hypothetical protein
MKVEEQTSPWKKENSNICKLRTVKILSYKRILRERERERNASG